MIDRTTKPHAEHYPALLQAYPSGDDQQLGRRCRLFTKDGVLEAWTWLDLARERPYETHRGVAFVMPVNTGRADNLLLGFSQTGKERISCLLPEALCPIPGIVRQTTHLIDSLTIRPLRELVTQALLHPDVVVPFWTCPASRRDHHAYPGGLAEHSLEVAVAVSSSRGLPHLEQEMGVVYALLHDYGKLWWFDPDLRCPEERRNHETLGRDKLLPELQILSASDPLLAAAMDELLGGPQAPRDQRYPLAIRKVVQAFDQMSCEKTRTTLAEMRETYALDAPF